MEEEEREEKEKEKDSQQDFEQHIFTLVSLFEKEKCMNEPKTCLQSLVRHHFSQFPGFGEEK